MSENVNVCAGRSLSVAVAVIVLPVLIATVVSALAALSTAACAPVVALLMVPPSPIAELP